MNRNPPPRSFDICVFGCTGYTGKLIVEYLAHTNLPVDRLLLCARSRESLHQLRDEVQEKNASYAKVNLRVVDVKDEQGVREMCGLTKVLINCVGPFALFSEVVVQACIDMHTDYVDITGEPNFIAEMIEKYHEKAQSEDVLIIPACGFDSVPADLGVYYARREIGFDQAVAVEGVVDIRGRGGLSHGTWSTLLESFANASSMKATRDKHRGGQSKKILSKSFHRLSSSWWGPFALPFPVADPFLVKRTSTLMDSPVDYGHFVRIRNIFTLFLTALGFLLLAIGSRIPFLKRLLAKLRSPGSGPSRDALLRDTYSVTFSCFNADAKKVGVCEVFGGNVYASTALFVVEAARTILECRADLPNRGVLTPAAALRDLYLDRLKHANEEYMQKGFPRMVEFRTVE